MISLKILKFIINSSGIQKIALKFPHTHRDMYFISKSSSWTYDYNKISEEFLKLIYINRDYKFNFD